MADELTRQGIATTFLHRGGDPAKEVQGVTFTKDDITFKASQIDRKFSYGNLCKQIETNRAQAEAESQEAEKRKQKELVAQQKRQQRQEAARLRKEEQARRTKKEFEKLWGEMFSDSIGEKFPKPEPKQTIGRSEEAQKAPTERQPIREPEIPSPAAEPDNPPTGQPRERITEIRGRKLTPEELKLLYSPQGLTLTYCKDDIEYTKLYRPFSPANGPDILTEHPVSEKRIDKNPTVRGVRLSDEQVQKIKEGECIRLEGMKREDGTLFSAYIVMDDQLKAGWIFQQPPDRMVKYGKYEMREMDKTLIENDFVTHARVKWWGMGQTARLYLWKEKPEDTDYKESGNDPRKPAQAQRITVRPPEPQQKKNETQEHKKGRGL